MVSAIGSFFWSSFLEEKDWSYGKFKKTPGGEKPLAYHLEASTGDLYGVQESNGKIDTPLQIRAKAIGIFLGSTFYAMAMMAVNAIRIAIDVSKIFWQVIPKWIKEIHTKGLFPSLGNAAIVIIWEIPNEITKDIWRILRSPFYGSAMMVASLFAMVFPFEGRTWLGKIEYEWHEKTSHRMDIRYRKSDKECKQLIFSREIFSALKAGKVFYLGYCMQKRGNISDLTPDGGNYFEKVS